MASGYDDKFPQDKARGHVWIMVDCEGEMPDYVDYMAYYSGEYHNGPRCATCGYGYCHHCYDGPQKDCPGTDATLAESGDSDDSKLDPSMTAYDAAIRARI